MSVKIMGAVFDLPIPKPEKFLLLALADHAHDDGTSVRPGLRRLAAKTSDSERNVRRLLRSLEELGILVPVAFQAGGRGHATEYRIDLGQLAAKGDEMSGLPEKEDMAGTESRTPQVIKAADGVLPTIREPSLEPSVERAPRKRDPIWDELVVIFGAVSNEASRGARNTAVKLLRESGATPDEILHRTRAWSSHFGDATLTPTALAKHWDALGLPPARVPAGTRRLADAADQLDRFRNGGPDA